MGRSRGAVRGGGYEWAPWGGGSGPWLREFSSRHRDDGTPVLLRCAMGARELTRRSLLAAAGGGLAAGLLRPRAAWGRAGFVSNKKEPAARGHGQTPRARGGAFELATPTLPAGGGQPPIVAREVWARGSCTPRVAPEYGSVELAVVHHTENPNGYSSAEVPAMLRAIFRFHRDVRGWNDIGYNFVVDRFGRIFEGRAGGIDESVCGAQAGGYNYCSTGIAVLGEYGGVRISPAARAALARLLAWKLALHGVPIGGRVVVRVNPAGAVYSRFPANARVSLPRVAGHRDADSTDCPGDALYGELPGVRLSAARLQGTPAVVTLELAPAPPPAAAPEAPPAGTSPPAASSPEAPAGGAPQPTSPPPAPVALLTGRLVRFGGAPLVGAPIELQARSSSRRGEQVRERTLGQARTGADGIWSLPLYASASAPALASPTATGVLAADTWLRALCPGAAGIPAAVSEAVRVGGAYSLAPAAGTPSTGTPSA